MEGGRERANLSRLEVPSLMDVLPGEQVPAWAVAQHRLTQRMSEAAVVFLDRYTRADGTFVWRDSWAGMDGSDDAYEAFQGMPLLYLLGGPDWLLPRAHRQWDAATWQFSRFGQVEREFDGYYDWMHHGEASEILYYFGLADPGSLQQRDRALRFAAMYTGEDPLAPNWDAERRLMRSPLTGSRGPRLRVTAEDWSTHRHVLDLYPPPFEDLPGVDPNASTCPWTDDSVYTDILRLFNERMASGDVPLNLTATGLVTHAYLWTGDDKYKRWVIDYLDAWVERIEANGGVCPDNIGPSGMIGECNGGRWWGGYYGWWWPHGAIRIVEALTIAGCNAALLDGDLGHLDPARSQLDLLLKHAVADGDRSLLPGRHGRNGWHDHDADRTLMQASYAVTIWELSQRDDDLERVRQLIGAHVATAPASHVGKSVVGNRVPFFRYRAGENPSYPEQILAVGDQLVTDRLQLIKNEAGELARLEVDDWHQRSPMVCEPLVQLTTGGSGNQYHGGLLHVPVRHFDGDRRRPGLPEDVAVIVDEVGVGRVGYRAVNLGDRPRRLVTQAGAFGEHRFDGCTVTVPGGSRSRESTVQQPEARGRFLEVELAPGAETVVTAGLLRHRGSPSYETPWRSTEGFPVPIRPRQI